MKKITFLFFALMMSVLSWQGTAQSGSTCDDPLVVTSMPFTDSGNTSTYGQNYTGANVPPLAPGAVTDGTGSSYYLDGDEVVYSYTAGANGTININTTNDDDWIGLWVFTGCPFTSTVGYHTATGGATRSIPNLPVIAGETYFVVISTWPSPQSTNYTISIDGTDVADPPTCPKPSNITVSNLSLNSADVSWTENGTATVWDLEYGIAGFDQGNGTMMAGLTNTSASITGLNSNTQYSVYVRAVCGTNDSSFWTGPVNFRTACDVISVLPYTEDFDTYGTGPAAFPACWERVTYTSGTAVWPSIVSAQSTSSPNSLRFNSAVGIPTYAISPPFAEDIENLRVSFMLRREGTNSGTIDVGVMSDASDTSTFELVQTIDPANSVWMEHVINLNQVTLSGPNNFIAIRHNSNSSSWYYWLDDFEVSLVPSCVEPNSLTLVNTTFDTSAEISWTAGGTEASWNVSWGPVGYTPGDADEIDTASAAVTNYEITGLEAGLYDIYVQADCGNNDLSFWTGPLTVTTGYCIPTGSSNNGDEIRNFTLGNLDNDSAASEGTNGYSDYSSSVAPAELEAGETYVASLTSGSGSGNHGAAIWIDYNQDGVFDASEMVAFIGNSIGSNTTVDFPAFTVPAPTADGTYRLRVQYHYSKAGDLLDPCVATSSFSETEDYAVIIGDGSGEPGFACEFAHEVVGDANGGAGSSMDSDYKSAVDIMVAAGQNFTLETILVPFLTFAPEDAPITASVVYYDNNGGFPGTVLGSETVVPTILSSGEWVNPIAYEFKTQLDMTPFTFNGSHGIETTYWVEISMGTATNQETVFWAYTEGTGIEGAPFVQFNAGTGAWSVPDATREGIYNFAGECSLLDPLGDCSGTPDGGVATVNPVQGNVGISYTVSATGFSAGYTGLTYQWQSNTDGAGWVDEGDTEIYYSSYSATAPMEIGIEVEWRLEVTCTLSQETSYSDAATFTTILDYCQPSSSIVEPITRVVFAGIDNSSSASSTESYEDFTSIIAQVAPGSTHSFAAEGFTDGDWDNYFTVWIDWDQNGEFDADEMYEIGFITNSDGTDGQQAVNDILVPADALEGDTRMRVRKNFNSFYTDPCDNNSFGQTEDYTVNVDATVGVFDHTVTDFSYYPNPVDDVLNISAKEKVESISVYNMLGQEVLNSRNFADGKMNVSSLPTGTFMVRVIFENGLEESFKVLKK